MKRKKEHSGIVIAILVILLLALIGILAYAFMKFDELKQYSLNLEYEMEANKQTVYVVVTPNGQGILKGTKIEEGVNVEKQQIVSGYNSNWYITEEDLGKIVTVDAQEGTAIMTNMVTEVDITQDVRLYELCVVDLMTTQRNDEYVDIRIMFPTGEDYLVLTKKPVSNLSLENNVFTSYLSEEEILLMASATVDAFTVTGTKLYTTSYVEPSLQNGLIPTYVAKAETIDLIRSDPNLLITAEKALNSRARMSLESRLKGLTEEYLAAVSAGHKLQDTAQNSVLQSNAEVSDDEMVADDNYETLDAETVQEDIENATVPAPSKMPKADSSSLSDVTGLPGTEVQP